MSGLFLTLEGGEGVGKSTQAARLADALRARGRAVTLTREPGGSEGAEVIRTLLTTGDGERWNTRAELLLFSAGRADHVAKVIRPALNRGDDVICDRYVDSTRAYQGGAGGLHDADIIAVHRLATDNLWPIRTLLLQLPRGEAVARLHIRDPGPDRFDRKGPSYHIDTLARFDQIASEDTERVRRIDASGSAEAVTSRLLAAIDDLL